MVAPTTLSKFKTLLKPDSLTYIKGYTNLSSKATFKCPKCNSKFLQWPKEALRGRCANKCRHKTAFKEKSLSTLIDMPDSLKFTGNYQDRKPIFKCTEGHEFAQAAHRLITRKYKCPECVLINKQNNKRSAAGSKSKQVKKIVESKGYTFVKWGGFEKTSLEFLCDNNHTVKYKHGDKALQEGLRCRECDKHATKINQLKNRIDGEASLLTFRSYWDSDLKCLKCGHLFTFGKTDKRGHCPRCWFVASKKSTEEWNKELKPTGVEVIKVDLTEEVPYICRCFERGHVFKRVYLGNKSGCPECCSTNRYSLPHKKLVNWFKKQNINCLVNCRKLIKDNLKLEIDIVLPDYKIAIEVDGVYWHSERFGDNRNNRLLRRTLIESEGYKLLRFWDFEFDNPKPMLSYIVAILGKCKTRIGARECEIREVPKLDRTIFLNTWHIQGDLAAPIAYGLYYKDELVSVMSFCKPRHSKEYEWEIARLCTKGSYSIQGGASRLFSAFNKKYKPVSVVSYADRRYSLGNVYSNLGFTLQHVSQPGYFYTGKLGRLSRYQTQKHKLNKVLGKSFDADLSEHENMKNSGYVRSYDCGQFIFGYGDIKAVKPTYPEPTPKIIKRKPKMTVGEYKSRIPSNLTLDLADDIELLRKSRYPHTCSCGNEWETFPYLVLNSRKTGCPKCANRIKPKDVKGLLKANNPDFRYIDGLTTVTAKATFKHVPTGIVFENKVFPIVHGKFPHIVRSLYKQKFGTIYPQIR